MRGRLSWARSKTSRGTRGRSQVQLGNEKKIVGLAGKRVSRGTRAWVSTWERRNCWRNERVNRMSLRALSQIRGEGVSLANAIWLAWPKKLRLPLKKSFGSFFSEISRNGAKGVGLARNRVWERGEVSRNDATPATMAGLPPVRGNFRKWFFTGDVAADSTPGETAAKDLLFLNYVILSKGEQKAFSSLHILAEPESKDLAGFLEA